MLKYISIFFLLILPSQIVLSQQNYNGHEGTAFHYFGFCNGILDSAAVNPGPNHVNNSEYCAKYRRNKEEIYDNIKLQLHAKLNEVESYATYEGDPPKITIKVFSTAPIGTQIELQLGKVSEIAYPDGVHSQYQAKTSKQNEWEELTFLFAQIPQGSKVDAMEVDQITILFAPQSQINNVFFYDDLTGPGFLTTENQISSDGY
ncbi:MAG: hypothetical protein M3Q58_13345 [Bacteroidota bacterium]|nr:hypothetical protein [Bacteroidota bacterium]